MKKKTPRSRPRRDELNADPYRLQRSSERKAARLDLHRPPSSHVGDRANDVVAVSLTRADAIGLGHTLRSMAFLAPNFNIPPDTASLFNRAGDALVDAATRKS